MPGRLASEHNAGMSGFAGDDAMTQVLRPAPFGLRVRRGPVPTSLGAVGGPGALGTSGAAVDDPVEVDDGRVLVRFPDAWGLLVEAGRDVTVDWPGASEPPSWIVDSW